MALVRRSLADPFFQKMDLLGSQRLVRLRRRHHFVGIRRANPSNQFALFGLSRNDGSALVGGSEQPFAGIEPQVGLAFVAIGPVTEETVVRKDGADIAVKRDRSLGSLGVDLGGARAKQKHERQAGEAVEPIRRGKHQ